MKNYLKFRLLTAFALVSLTLPLAVSAQKNAKGENLPFAVKYSGTVVTNNGRTPSFLMDIKGITSDADVKTDLSALREKGQDGFLKAIEKENLGYFSLDGQVGQTLKYVTKNKTADGTKIIGVFERWLQPFEIRSGARSTDYPFTYVELFFDNNGKGSGMIIGAARVEVDKNSDSIDFENFGAFPAQLLGIQVNRKE